MTLPYPGFPEISPNWQDSSNIDIDRKFGSSDRMIGPTTESSRPASRQDHQHLGFNSAPSADEPMAIFRLQTA
jgi:hypothetical protein